LKNNFLKIFIAEILITTILSALIFSILVIYSGISLNLFAVFSGWLLSLLNIIAGTRFILNAIKKDNKKFFIIVFGSMSVRLFITLIFVVIGLVVLKFNEYSFIFSLFGYYFIFLFFEILYLNSELKLSKKQQ
jgi:hypothetical protein